MHIFSTAEIKSIIEYTEIGYVVYIHKDTGKIIPVPDCDPNIYGREIWEENLDYIEANAESLIEFNRLENYERARLAEKFIRSLDDRAIAERLDDILSLHSGLKNFEYKVRDFDLQKEWDNCRFERIKDNLIFKLRSAGFSVQSK